MDTRTIIAVVLSIAVLYGYSLLIPQKPASPPVQGRLSSVASSPAPPVPLPVPAPSRVPAPHPLTDQDVVVETDHYRAVFSTRGAALRSFSLKGYRQSASKNSPPVVLYQALSPDDLTLVTESAPLGISSVTPYTASASSLTLSGTQTGSIDFTAQLAGGITLVKRYSFSGSRFPVSVTHILSNRTASPVTAPLVLTMRHHVAANTKSDSRYEIEELALLQSGSVTHLPLKDILKEGKRYASPGWVAFGDKYFLSALISDATSPIRSADVTGREALVESRILLAEPTLQPSTGVTLTTSLYCGPKDIDILKSVGARLEDAVDLGWFAVIAKPFLLTLKFLYRYVGNYGLAIIIITVVLKILFYPLTYKSYKSMKEMQKLQPLMEKIKEKYKDDRNAMNQEVMKLYQEHRVNPLGGCLPMVIQIPVFFALYKALMFSIELRHAPFYFWITDLSAKDPYYITPIIMGATMFIQQKMTPTSMDPTQAKIMLMLPVIFTFMFLNFPSGLVIYWLVNNILSIAQQYYINRSVSA